MITYFKSQKDLADTLIKVIDAYWKMEISEAEFIQYLHQVYQNNTDKILNNSGFTSIFSQRLGKKRLSLVMQILKLREYNER